MAKKKPPTKTVRLTVVAADDLSFIAEAFGIQVHEYIDAIVRPAIERDMPQAKKMMAERQQLLKKLKEPSSRLGGESRRKTDPN